MQIFSAPIEFKASPPDGEGVFAARAASFGRVDRQGDTVIPGAFATTLKSWDARRARIPLLWSHDPQEPIGAIASAAELDAGLEVIGKLALSGSANARRAFDLMKTGGVSLSIGFCIPKDGARLRSDGVREIKAIDLHEISVVSLPADPHATIREVKSIATLSENELQDLLRQRLGLSRRESKRLIEGGFKALRSTSDDQEALLAARRIQLLTQKLRIL